MFKPNFIGVLCYATQGTLRPSPSLFPSLVKVLRLSPLNEVIVRLLLGYCLDISISFEIIDFLMKGKSDQCLVE